MPSASNEVTCKNSCDMVNLKVSGKRTVKNSLKKVMVKLYQSRPNKILRRLGYQYTGLSKKKKKGLIKLNVCIYFCRVKARSHQEW